MPNSSPRAFGRTNAATGVLLCLALAGCNIDYEVIEAEEGDGTAGIGSGGSGGSGARGPRPLDGEGGSAGPPPLLGSGGSSASAPPDYVCRLGGDCSEVAVTNIDQVDLLFMIDNSGSMLEEQLALIEQFPKLVSVLASGDRDGDGNNDFPPAKSLHLGVVSSDLGLVGISGIDKCQGLGDDGVMNDVASAEVAGCSPGGYPRFLTYSAGVSSGVAGAGGSGGSGGSGAPWDITPSQIANDFACIATLGEDGCGFEQQLETTLKALWPADDSRITFLPDPQGNGARGQGDNGGMNAGFLRSDPVQGLSVVSIVLVTDEEDCSSKDTGHLRPPAYLNPSNPEDVELFEQGLNTRCHFNPDNLYIADRYINGFKALRPGHEELVLFSALVGVPPETVAQVPSDYGDNAAARAAFYDGIRSHALMQPIVDTLGTPAPDDDTMRPSCDTASGKAYPPNRIVDVAEGFGANGMVQSICQDDFGPAIDAIIARIAPRLGSVCSPTTHVRDADGLLSCEVIWELPPGGKAPVGTPTECSQAPFLLPLADDARTAEDAALCRVAQLAVRPYAGSEMSPVPTETDGETFSDGWYYDDFSDETLAGCMTSPKARIAFTPSAMPPTGVRVYLDCE